MQITIVMIVFEAAGWPGWPNVGSRIPRRPAARLEGGALTDTTLRHPREPDHPNRPSLISPGPQACRGPKVQAASPLATAVLSWFAFPALRSRCTESSGLSGMARPWQPDHDQPAGWRSRWPAPADAPNCLLLPLSRSFDNLWPYSACFRFYTPPRVWRADSPHLSLPPIECTRRVL